VAAIRPKRLVRASSLASARAAASSELRWPDCSIRGPSAIIRQVRHRRVHWPSAFARNGQVPFGARLCWKTSIRIAELSRHVLGRKASASVGEGTRPRAAGLWAVRPSQATIGSARIGMLVPEYRRLPPRESSRILG
jgi:hypothetical protein